LHTVKDLVLFATVSIALVLVLVAGPLLLARYTTVKHHQEQFKATGAASFPLPTVRGGHRRDEEGWQTEPTEPVATVPASPMAIIDTDTGELVRLGVDGLPMSEADLAARTAPTTLTVDPEHLAAILQLESTSEYPMNAPTWVECDAAELFMRNPLTTPLLPPQPLIEEAGNPSLAETFWTLVHEGKLSTDWTDADSEFHFWDRDTPLAGALVGV
jgi:hypothetical protein